MSATYTPQERGERREKVRLLTQEGRSLADICDVLGVSERTVVRDRKALGLPPQWNMYPWTPEELRLARNLLEDECPYAEVGRTLGISYHLVQRRFPGMGRTGSPLGNGRHLRLAHELGLGLRK